MLSNQTVIAQQQRGDATLSFCLCGVKSPQGGFCYERLGENHSLRMALMAVSYFAETFSVCGLIMTTFFPEFQFCKITMA